MCDFTDGWILDIRFEAILAADTKAIHPRCTAGRRAAPPEDCGGCEAYLARLDRYEIERWRSVTHLAEAGNDRLSDALDAVAACARFRPEHFDRRAVNGALRGLATGIGDAS